MSAASRVPPAPSPAIAAAAEVPVGREYGPWRVLSLLGSGGFANVYKCQHRFQTERLAAVKVLLPNRDTKPEFRDRFLLEIRLTTQIKNPNVVVVHDADMMSDGSIWMAMELLEGKPLDQLIEERGRFDVLDGLKIMGDVADGIQAAHAIGAIHRDLKPANIFVTTTGVVKILDLGVAKLVDRRIALNVLSTEKNKVPGSLPYMSPEQVSAKPLDYRSDIFSLGVIGYQLFTGRYPFADHDGSLPRDVGALIGRIVIQSPPGPRDPRVGSLAHGWQAAPEPGDLAWQGVPYSVWLMVQRALEKAPADRYRSMADLKRDVTKLLAGRLLDEGLPERPLLGGAPSASRARGFDHGLEHSLLVAAAQEPRASLVAQVAPPMEPVSPAPAATRGSAQLVSKAPITPNAAHAVAVSESPRQPAARPIAGRLGTVPMPHVRPRRPIAGPLETVPMPHVTPELLAQQAALRAQRSPAPPVAAAASQTPATPSMQSSRRPFLGSLAVVALVTVITAVGGVTVMRLRRPGPPATSQPPASSPTPEPASPTAPATIPSDSPLARAASSTVSTTGASPDTHPPARPVSSVTAAPLATSPALATKPSECGESPAAASALPSPSSGAGRMGLPYDRPRGPPTAAPTVHPLAF